MHEILERLRREAEADPDEWEALLRALLRGGNERAALELLEARLPGPDEEPPLAAALFALNLERHGHLGDRRALPDPGIARLLPGRGGDHVLAVSASAVETWALPGLVRVPEARRTLRGSFRAVAPGTRGDALLVTSAFQRFSPGIHHQSVEVQRWRGTGAATTLARIPSSVLHPGEEPDEVSLSIEGAAFADAPLRGLLWIATTRPASFAGLRSLVLIYQEEPRGKARVRALPLPGPRPEEVRMAVASEGSRAVVGALGGGRPQGAGWRGRVVLLDLPGGTTRAVVPAGPGLLDVGIDARGERVFTLHAEGPRGSRLRARRAGDLRVEWEAVLGPAAPATRLAAPRILPGPDGEAIRVLGGVEVAELDAATGELRRRDDPGLTGPLLDMAPGQEGSRVYLHSREARVSRDPTRAFAHPVTLGCLDGSALFPRRANQGHQAPVTELWVATGGNRVVALDASRELLSWDPRTGALLGRTRVAAGALALDRGARILAEASAGRVRIRRLDSGREIARVSLGSTPLRLLLLKKGKLLVVATSRTLHGFELGESPRGLWTRPSSARLPSLVGCGSGALFAFAPRASEPAALLDAATGEEVATWDPAPGRHGRIAALFPGGARARAWARVGDRMLAAVPPGTRPLRPRELPAGTRRVVTSPDGGWILAATAKELVLLAGRGPVREHCRVRTRDAEAFAVARDGWTAWVADGPTLRVVPLPRQS